MKNYRRRNTKAVCLFMALFFSLYTAAPALAAGAEAVKEGEGQGQAELLFVGWRKLDESWLYYDYRGQRLSGWQLINGRWYFLNPLKGEAEGRMLTGWQWIDGKCYYLAEIGMQDQPQGAMYADGMTPDGYHVDPSGAWTDASGKVQFILGKGIQTGSITKAAKASGFSRGSSSGGSGGGSRRSVDSSISYPTSIPSSEEPGTESQTPQTPEPEKQTPGRQQFSYTIKYLDLETRAVLRTVAQTGEAATFITVDFPEIKGFEPCKDQPEDFLLAEEGMEVLVYYAPLKAATPSQAKKVRWELRFVEAASHENEIFKSQKGETEENTELTVDFPETIVGRDGCLYHALTASPWRTRVNGTGTQKYYIEYQKGESIPKEEDPDQEAREKLKEWLEAVRASDFQITGKEPLESQMITQTPKESGERLLNLVSMADGGDRKEIYLIARAHTPSAAVIGQTFKDVTNLSELILDRFEIEGESYTVLRVGFERTYEVKSCTHEYETASRKSPSCMENGYETVQCSRCQKEETCLLPATGHMDADNDGICDICYKSAEEEPEAARYQIGDVQARNIGGRIYLFRCIDDDYEDAMDNSQRTALFLCERVIRSDTDRSLTGFNKLSFGSDNNYKHSKVRKWLQENAEDARFNHSSYIGITHSYEGMTESKAYDQLSEDCLIEYDRKFQLMEDRVFCLSMEEALKYREELWRFEGSGENNPESQMSAYSRGYYLRSPQKGPGIYVVDLADGSIHPAEVTSTDIGIRPAMTLPQA